MQQFDFEALLMNNQNFFSSFDPQDQTNELYIPDSLFNELTKNDVPNKPTPSPITQTHPRPNHNRPKKKRKTTPVTIEKLLNPLKKDQLETVILELIQKHPEIEHNIRDLLPTFDVSTAIQDAQKLKQKIFQAFPNTRYGSSYDHYSFNRVKSSQSAYITAVRKPISVMSSAKQWNELLDYLLAIIEESAEIPDWDCEDDQKSKKALFKTFASNLLKVLNQKEDELTCNELEQIKNLCVTHNTAVHGAPFTDCIAFASRK